MVLSSSPCREGYLLLFFHWFLVWTVLGLRCCWFFSLSAASGVYSLAAVHGLLTAGASLVAEHGLSGVQASVAVAHGPDGCSSQALEHGLSSWGAQA